MKAYSFTYSTFKPGPDAMPETIQDLISNLSGIYQKESTSPLCSIDETQFIQIDFKGIVNEIASLSDEKRHSGVFELAKINIFVVISHLLLTVL